MDGQTQTDVRLPNVTTLNGLVEQFRGHAEAAAIVALDQSGSLATRSYSELAGEISRLAVGLAHRGLVDGKMIMLWAPNCPEWVVAYFAITVAGNVVIPVDDQIPVEGLGAVLRHSRPACVFTIARHLQVLDASDDYAGGTCILLDEDREDAPGWRRVCREHVDGQIAAPSSERVASLLYTSGTTGPPKAVPLTHANLMSNVRALVTADLITTEDRVLVPLPLFHAYPATVGMLGALGSGAALILPSGVSGPELTAAAKQARATVLLGVPRLYTALVESIESAILSGGFAVRALYALLIHASMALNSSLGIRVGRIVFRRIHNRVGASLRILASGGAKLEPALARKLEGLGWEVYTGYGLTETSPVVTFNSRQHKRLDSQGFPLTGIDIDIRKNREEPNGEILVKGPNVFSGYWKNEAATQAAFTPDGWFRTGDLGYLDRDGYLHVVGRSKEIIVLPDGENVSPEIVEQMYEASPFIREVAVLERNGALAALIVPDDDAIRLRGAMREEALLREETEKAMRQLPSYQRIAEYRLTRRSLPRTRLAKLRRHLLPEIFESAAKAGAVPKQTELSELDSELLQSATVSAVWRWLQERFVDTGIALDSSPQLDLGIDSLKWVTITSEIEKEFGIVLSADALSRVLTIRDLLHAVAIASRATTVPEPPHRWAQRYLQNPGPPLRLFGWLLLMLNRLLMRTCFRLRVEGRDRLPTEGPFVVTPNHASYLDPLAVSAALPLHLVSNACWAGWAGKMHKGPVYRAVSRALRVFPVDPDQDLGGGIRLGAQALEDGRVLVWFPEGRRSHDGSVQPFQRGVGVLLDESRVKTVPVRVKGSFEAWPLTRAWPRPRRVAVVFGSPQTAATLAAQGRGDDAPAQICDALERCVRNLTD